MTEIQLCEALAMLMAAIQMGCVAILAATFPVWAIQALTE